jgi:hypothetical protein
LISSEEDLEIVLEKSKELELPLINFLQEIRKENKENKLRFDGI